MANKNLMLSSEIVDYLRQVALREPEILTRLRAETADMPQANMQIAPEQGQFMSLLLRLIGARSVLEVGTFTGYSSLVMALALPDDGHITTCDVSEQFTATAKRYWLEAGVADRIDLRLGPALESLQSLADEGRRGSFDFAFIDADKENYDAYFEAALELVRPGGLIGVDNVLWGGSVIDPTNTQSSTEAIRAFNENRAGDPRVEIAMVPIADGLTLLRKPERTSA